MASVVYTFGVGLLVAELTQLMHGKTAGWLRELWTHLSSPWNVLDVSIIALIVICACQRLPSIVTVENVETAASNKLSFMVNQITSFFSIERQNLVLVLPNVRSK